MWRQQPVFSPYLTSQQYLEQCFIPSLTCSLQVGFQDTVLPCFSCHHLSHSFSFCFWIHVICLTSEVSVFAFTSLLSLHLLSISASSFSVYKRMQSQCLNVNLLWSPEWNIQLLSSWMASDTTNLKYTKMYYWSPPPMQPLGSQVRNSYFPDYCNNCPTVSLYQSSLPAPVYSTVQPHRAFLRVS